MEKEKLVPNVAECKVEGWSYVVASSGHSPPKG